MMISMSKVFRRCVLSGLLHLLTLAEQVQQQLLPFILEYDRVISWLHMLKLLFLFRLEIVAARMYCEDAPKS